MDDLLSVHKLRADYDDRIWQMLMAFVSHRNAADQYIRDLEHILQEQTRPCDLHAFRRTHSAVAYQSATARVLRTAAKQNILL